MNGLRRKQDLLQADICSRWTRKVHFHTVDDRTEQETLTCNKVGFCWSDRLKKTFFIKMNLLRKKWDSLKADICSRQTRNFHFHTADDSTGNETMTCNQVGFCWSDRLEKTFLIKMNGLRRKWNLLQADICSGQSRKVHFHTVDDSTGNETMTCNQVGFVLMW